MSNSIKCKDFTYVYMSFKVVKRDFFSPNLLLVRMGVRSPL